MNHNRFIGGIPELQLAAIRPHSLGSHDKGHFARLEAAGQFPKRVRLGQHRVGWVKDEVLEWLQQRIERRDGGL